MPKTLAFKEPHPTREILSRLVREAALQTMDTNFFVTVNGSGDIIPAVVNAAGSLSMALEPGHNFAVVGANNLIEILQADTHTNIEISLMGVATLANTAAGALFGINTQVVSGKTIYVADSAQLNKTLICIGLAGRDSTAPASTPPSGWFSGSGSVGDTNVRVIVRFAATVALL